MKIIWHGHSCFEITGKDGTIVFDPYQANSVPGLNPLKLKANLVLCSHEHEDHNARNCVETTAKDFKVTCIAFLKQAVWIIILYIISSLMWKNAVKKLVHQGG